MKKLFLFTATLFILAATAQTRQYISHTTSGSTLTINVSDGRYAIEFYSEGVVQTTFFPTGKPDPERGSHAVVASPQNPAMQTHQKDNIFEYGTSGIAVQIEKSPFKLRYYYKNKLLLSEKNGYTAKDSAFVTTFQLDPNEALYGGGSRVLGMNRRGHRLELYNRAHYGYETHAPLMNFCMPMALSSKIYMVHFDNASTGWLDLDSAKTNTLAYESSGRTTYQVIAASNWARLLDHYTQLTGRQPLLPRWALGNFSSRFGYHSQQEAQATIALFRKHDIPVDAIILDLYWFGAHLKGTMGNLEVFRDSFPDFEGMVRRFNQENVKTIPITEPFILSTSKRWNEAVSAGILANDTVGKPARYDFYFGNTGLIDVFKPKARAWFWNIYKDLAGKGVAGVWGDLGEPEVHPDWVVHHTGTARGVHNIYGHEWAGIIASGYARDFPKVRPFVLMRSGYSGSQRFGMIPWSGDVSRSWGGLAGQPELALQMGLQGMAFMHSDLGGFAGNMRDPELYVRWLQYGVFQPVFRPHAQEDVPSEPVFWDAKTRDLAKQAIELRYRFLPYNYTAAFKNSQSGLPLMRPLFFEEPSKDELFNQSANFLWGDDVLVAPVLEKGQKAVEVYFPKTSNWYDVFGKKYKGGSHLQVVTRENQIPYFIRGGSFIPQMRQKVKSTADYNPAELYVHYIYDPDVKESTGMFYDDDGVTAHAHALGEYEILHFKSTVKGNRILFTITPETGKNWKPQTRKLTFTVFRDNRMVDLDITLKPGKKTTTYIKLPTR